MKLNKLFTLKASAIAVAAVVSGQAFAAVNLDTTPTSIKYASEQTVAGTGSNLAVGAASDLTANVTLGATFAVDAVAYVRFDLSAGTFTAAPTVTVTGGTAAVAQGGTGQNFVIYALSPTAATALATTATVASVAAGGITVTSQSAVNITYRLFETLTNAANQTLPLKTVSAAPFIAFSPALTFTATAAATSPIADVSATGGSYTDFTVAGEKALGRFGVALNAVALQSGAAATVAAVLTDTSTASVTGDFSLAASDGAAGYDATSRARVQLDTSATCASGAPAAGVNYGSATLSATTATFTGLTAANITTGLTLCVTPELTPTIASSAYTGAVDLVPQTGFTLTDPAAAYASITRNGGQVDVRSYIPAGTVGYTSFVRVINAGTASVPVSGQWLYENGTQGVSAVLGTVAAGGSITWNSTTVEAQIGAPTVIGNNRPRLRITAPSTGLQVQSFFLNPGNSFATMHGAD